MATNPDFRPFVGINNHVYILSVKVSIKQFMRLEADRMRKPKVKNERLPTAYELPADKNGDLLRMYWDKLSLPITVRTTEIYRYQQTADKDWIKLRLAPRLLKPWFLDVIAGLQMAEIASGLQEQPNFGIPSVVIHLWWFQTSLLTNQPMGKENLCSTCK